MKRTSAILLHGSMILLAAVRLSLVAGTGSLHTGPVIGVDLCLESSLEAFVIGDA
ncbi:hypothetical protein [Ktedonospora formicarum]|uniref:hypothetical protein n=1 Tax=Ktedonospora formicarum TaxID=2778364 RepID=UPI001C6917CD|nr:hypothetical protein [Ktedonospora formicarum]